MKPGTAAGTEFEKRIAALFVDLREHLKAEPAEVERLVGAMTSHLIAWVPGMVVPDLEIEQA